MVSFLKAFFTIFQWSAQIWVFLALASFTFKPEIAMLSIILTVAKDLFDGFRQPTMLHSFSDDTWDTSCVYDCESIITITQLDSEVIISWSQN